MREISKPEHFLPPRVRRNPRLRAASQEDKERSDRHTLTPISLDTKRPQSVRRLDEEEVEVLRRGLEISDINDKEAELIRQLEEDVRSICASPLVVQSSSESYDFSDSEESHQSEDLLETRYKPSRCYDSAPEEGERHSKPQSGIITNLLYNLEHLRVLEKREAYQRLVDSVVVGPACIGASDLQHLLGINNMTYSKARGRRKALIEGGIRPSWGEGSSSFTNPRLRASLRKTRLLHKTGMAAPPLQGAQGPRWKSCDLHAALHHQFELFSKFGESGSDGSQITLTQSDKWLRQAKVIDGWNLTTTDTAITFRKISRGSIWLEYNPWRQFLEELATRKELNMQEVTIPHV